MESFVRHFVRASLVWLGIGVLLGMAMALWPRAIVYRPAHMHANLLGFVSMMIFGVAYHVLPRFSGRPLHNRRLAAVHVWLGNVGLALLVSGWLLTPHTMLARNLVGMGALGAAAGAFAFIYNIWKTLDAAAAPLPFAAPQRTPTATQPGTRTS